MATPKFNSKSPTIRRILREAAEISNSPSPDYTATPLESDLFEWHFTFRGPPNSPYSDGIYHGRIVLPPSYPLRPPSFRFLTPSGRFETNREICLSISGHHEETWQPAWGVRTALVALRSFMETDPKGQLGGLETSDAVRRRHAAVSHIFSCSTCARTNLEIMQECEENAKAAAGSSEPATDVKIPSDLNMGWRDEMARSAGTEGGKPLAERSQIEQSDTESVELAEGFVPTASESIVSNSTALTSRGAVAGPGEEWSLARPAVTGPAATRTTTVPPETNIGQVPQLQHDEGVPLWVDRAIVALIVLLLAMVLKVLLEY